MTYIVIFEDGRFMGHRGPVVDYSNARPFNSYQFAVACSFPVGKPFDIFLKTEYLK